MAGVSLWLGVVIAWLLVALVSYALLVRARR